MPATPGRAARCAPAARTSLAAAPASWPSRNQEKPPPQKATPIAIRNRRGARGRKKKALVVFPGGYGTLDEMFEILTLVQTQKLTKKITVVIYGPEYWKRVFNEDTLVDTGAISPKDIDLFKFANSPKRLSSCCAKVSTQNYLAAEAASAAGMHGEARKSNHDEDLMAGWNMDDLPSPELAKTRK